jgi:hypothetical protein
MLLPFKDRVGVWRNQVLHKRPFNRRWIMRVEWVVLTALKYSRVLVVTVQSLCRTMLLLPSTVTIKRIYLQQVATLEALPP